ncbi:DUF4340 domain-containing protein [Hespellia stercorisuis]|uniref:DUF4340 domain-containing protein n=1 Tax=Hespellia stercorisuis DSM 15480 TaxID=1121950 RepID=A0A1M6UXK5_9FIRM|nr:DUF4340 domain-containing protein [Hespellia stercorisuis]SHK73861.1 protein of unknown function [Hespellia stercorisuis DSM 15480]
MTWNKNTKVMAGLLGALILLVVVYFGITAWNNKQQEKKDAKAEAEKIYVTDVAEVTEVTYDAGSGALSFAKEDDDWHYADNKDYPLDQSYVKTIADTFGKLEADRELTDGDSLADYGLEQPAYQVQLTGSDGTKSVVYIGNATGDYYYVTVDDTKKVYTVSASVVSDIQHTLEDMTKLDTFPTIGSGNLTKVEITENAKTTVYDVSNDDDTESIAAVAGGLGAVSLDTVAVYPDQELDLAKYGLDEAKRITEKVTYTSDDKEQTYTFYIGSEDGAGNRYLMVQDSDIVYTITTAVCSNVLNQGE